MARPWQANDCRGRDAAAERLDDFFRRRSLPVENGFDRRRLLGPPRVVVVRTREDGDCSPAACFGLVVFRTRVAQMYAACSSADMTRESGTDLLATLNASRLLAQEVEVEPDADLDLSGLLQAWVEGTSAHGIAWCRSSIKNYGGERPRTYAASASATPFSPLHLCTRRFCASSDRITRHGRTARNSLAWRHR